LDHSPPPEPNLPVTADPPPASLPEASPLPAAPPFRVPRWLALAAAGGVALAGLLAGLRVFAFRAAQKGLLLVGAPAARTPADAAIPFEPLAIASGRRRLAAWWVPAAPEADRGRAVLVFHGRNESLSEWIEALGYLRARGISSLVFDYSGFGGSTGAPTVANLRQDVQAAWRAFAARTPGKRRFALGLSLGTGFLLDGLPGFGERPAGVVLIAPYSSARRAAVATAAVSRAFSLLLPDLFNNVEAVRRLAAPLLVVHGREDRVLPLAMAEEVFAAAPEPKRLVVVGGTRHAEMLTSAMERVFAPVVRFLDEVP
jgi:uncharacterized protein